MDKKKEFVLIELIGKKIAGVVCRSVYRLNDIVVIIGENNICKVVKYSSIFEKVELFFIDNEEIVDVKVSDNASMFLFQTKSKQYLVNDENTIAEDSDNWEDSYFDELANSFYRKDISGYWYDIEGFRMRELVFLKEDVLISLANKRSKRSLSFRNQEVYISKNKQLIQIGKLLLDLNLEVVQYFGDKITGLGTINISFSGKDVLQEVKMGLDRFAFINEYSHEPFLIKGERIIKHLSTYHYGQKSIEVFKSDNNSYGVIDSSQNFLAFDGKPLQIVEEGHIHIGNSVLIKVNDGLKNFYFDLNTNLPFQIADNSIRTIRDIDPDYVRLGKERLYNVDNGSDRFVIRESDLTVFKLDDNSITPWFVKDANQLDEYFAFAHIDGKSKLFSKQDLSILHFGADSLEISKMNDSPHDKFINAVDANGNKVALDLRLGISKLKMAVVDGNKVSEVCSTAMRFNSTTVLNVVVEKLRGEVNRVVSINSEELTYFTLPNELVQTSAEKMPSVFAGNFFAKINYLEETIISSRVFISASFVSYTGKEFPLILNKESGDPLHLEGNGHRNELASNWIDHTLVKEYHLGANRMVCVNTITENLKEHQLLFSIEKLASWIPFFDNYLPIMRQVVEIEGRENENWKYYLFELGEVSKNREYLAVEKEPPYRLLTTKKDSGYYPRIIKSKSKSIKSPEELNLLQRIFTLDNEELVEVE